MLASFIFQLDKMTFLYFILLTAAIFVTVKSTINRNLIINQALEEVHEATSSQIFKASTQGTLGASKKTSSAYKHTSLEATKQGNARLKFEGAVKRAERKILEAEQKLHHHEAAGAQAKVEELAKELLHKPGTILTDDEITAVYEQSGCMQILANNVPDCSTAEARLYRTPTGVCNNLENPLFGGSRTPFRRLVLPQYEDGVSQLRGTFQARGSSLFNGGAFSPPNPSARLVSISVAQDRNIVEDNLTHLLMQWGQFVDHDLDLAPTFQEQCEGCTYTDKCTPIRIPIGDKSLDGRSNADNEVCQQFVRSIPACNSNPMHGVNPREQINELNSFIDGSQIYGSSEELFNAQRQPQSGRLQTGPNIPENGGESLPLDTNGLVECMGNQTCFLSGDVRVNEHTGLVVMHTIWMREHNRIADILRDINPTWANETIFQVTRQIVGAQLQKITYKDYLPMVMGEGYSLISNYTGYEKNTKPNVPNSFATAAFRFGHSQVQPFFNRLDHDFQPTNNGPLNLIDSFFNPREFTNSNGTDPILRGLLTTKARKVDEFLNDVLTQHLFQANDSTPGMDLASLNIQRGRDHGLPPYLTWKRWAQQECGVSSDLENELTMVRFLQTYGSLETVDLWIGGLAEKSLPGGIIGATFACIFAHTFEAIRNGDRFYYENNDTVTEIFTPGQRQAIENTSLARVICNNADNITSIQPNVFRSDQNHVPCSSLPDVDLTQWTTQCYLQIKVNRQMADLTFTSLSIPNIENGSGMVFTSTVPQGQKRTCLKFLCPNSTQNVTLTVFRDRTQMCRVKQNQQLPEDMANDSMNYIGTITPSDINPRSGLYGDINSCMGSNRFALRFWCGRDTATTKESILDELEDEVNMLEKTELSIQEWVSIKSNSQTVGKLISLQDPLIPKQVQQDLLQMKMNAQSSKTKHVGNNNKLITLLETVLNELKETRSQEDEPIRKEQISQDDNTIDDGGEFLVLYKKLIEALNQVDDKN